MPETVRAGLRHGDGDVVQGRVLEVGSDGMGDMEALLAIANVCQIVTVEDIKTMEDIKQRLSLKVPHNFKTHTTQKQVLPVCTS